MSFAAFRELLNDRNAFDAAAAVDGWPEKDWQTLLEEESCVLGVSLAGQLLTSWGLDGVRGLLVARRRG
jgi:hypothetical protein